MILRLPLFQVALVALVGLAAIAPASAQTGLKVAYIDPDRVIVQMPEFKQIQEQMRGEQQQVAARVRTVQDSLNTVLQTKMEEYETFDASPLATDEARQERQLELYQLQGGIEQAQSQGLQYLSYREAELLQPLQVKVDAAIRIVSQQQGIDLVLPSTANNAPVFLYVSNRLINITEAVMENLGIDLAAAAAPEGN
ncbi:MAG: OmpH family outer membrane protein [Bacteroidota bacterium]